MLIELEIRDPQVKAMLEAAVEAARAFWAGLTSQGEEVIGRRELYLEPIDAHTHANVNKLTWVFVNQTLIVDGVLISLTRHGPAISRGRLGRLDNPSSPLRICPDSTTIIIHPGDLTVDKTPELGHK